MANRKNTKGQTIDLHKIIYKSYRTNVNRAIVIFYFVIHYNIGFSFVEDDCQSLDDFTRIIHVTYNYIYRILSDI